MNHREVGEYWNANAEAWTQLSRAGYDVYRDWLNTPGFLEMLPNVTGMRGLDIGCGEGHNTRLVVDRGASMVAVDIASAFIEHAREAEARQCPKGNHDSAGAEPGPRPDEDSVQLEHRPGIEYAIASAVELPFPDEVFDFSTAFMSFMDIPETDLAIAEAYRVLRPGGFLQFSITHPCFDLPHRRNLRGPDGLTYAIEMGDYFRNLDGEITEWLFSTAPEELKAQYPKFKVPRFTRTLSEWFNLLVDAGFRIERVGEPYPSDEVVAQCFDMQDAQVVAYFLHIRVRKPRLGID